MFAEEIRRAVMVAPRVKLPDVAAVMWRAYGAGQITEAEAAELSELIERQREAPPPEEPARASAGSRPRTDASLERRRRWTASGRLPPALAARFTMGETAVLSVVAAEAIERGDCRLAVGHIAAVAGVSETTVRNAIRRARGLGLVTVEERPVTAWRNDTNIVAIVSAEWTSWLRLAKRRRASGKPSYAARDALKLEGGCKFANRTPTGSSRPVNYGHWKPRLSAGRQGCRAANASSGGS
ncbi:transcriptional regulator [Methylobacterium gnaphalii]|uniref:Uncharacterized protein n=1 Tax=Methylobacterium gnaphalii TaxID=1010610 RepID=A0A512JRD4_9HYPH|nr:transcriptional regulator [Methylobacterium gnaphalii]GEP12530.1 hypothetical protein MGN01_43750 [Methylobacterium gnaphalii]GLS51508.1 hypothetical protein GCM10007885_43660 [Methylobacterium gnaphalii]